MVATVVLEPAQVEAIDELALVADAVHVVQHDGARAVAKVGQLLGRDGRPAAQLSAHHPGVVHVPFVIAHRPPQVVVEHLHAALATTVTIHHTDGRLSWRAGGAGGAGG